MAQGYSLCASIVFWCSGILASSEMVSIYKVDFPVQGSCGQEENVTKSSTNPHYFFPIHFGGFHEGSCSDVGYSVFKGLKQVSMHPVPFVHHNLTFEIFAKPAGLTVNGCEAGGSSLCSCSELIGKRLIKSFDDCTQEAAMAACSSNKCRHSEELAVTGCEAGGSSLCGCSELISKHLIKSFDDCTQEAAMAACTSNKCRHSEEFTVASSSKPCCTSCELPLVKFFSTDAPHGFCGEACMDPSKFSIYHKFEANLTRATSDHPCSEQWTPSNTVKYTDYYQTVTHGVPGLLSVTLDLYAPTGMPDHSCCVTPLFASLNCVGIPGKSKSMFIAGTGPYCCPTSATETTPCASESSGTVVI